MTDTQTTDWRSRTNNVLNITKLVAGAGLIGAVLSGVVGATEQVQWVISILAAAIVFALNRLGYLAVPKERAKQ